MPFSILPKLVLNSVTEITPALLSQRGVKALFLDFDNTIVPYTTNRPKQKLVEWFSRMRRSGVILCVVSNSRKPRVVRFCERYGLPCVTSSRKPFQHGIQQALSRFGLEPKHTALVGDQIYTDVLGANCGGLYSILVRPLHLHNVWLRLRHLLEKPAIFLAKERHLRKKT